MANATRFWSASSQDREVADAIADVEGTYRGRVGGGVVPAAGCEHERLGRRATQWGSCRASHRASQPVGRMRFGLRITPESEGAGRPRLRVESQGTP